ncbi:hypothetical protein [Actinopolymorpha alba]|nr:hypothetical protein [Actinopolymorpha alba]
MTPSLFAFRAPDRSYAFDFTGSAAGGVSYPQRWSARTFGEIETSGTA